MLPALGWPGGSLENTGIIVGVVAAAFVGALWLAAIVWTVRDIRARSRDPVTQLVATLIVLLFNLPGWVLYLVLRPPSTLLELYEQELEEQALLQDLPSAPRCPQCEAEIRDDYLVCPLCAAPLKRRCQSCERPLAYTWKVCPWCATPRAVEVPAALSAAVQPPRVVGPRGDATAEGGPPPADEPSPFRSRRTPLAGGAPPRVVLPATGNRDRPSESGRLSTRRD